MAREHLGEINCKHCKKPIPVKKTAGGHITFPCGWCGFTQYAPPGTRSFRDISAEIRPGGDDDEGPPKATPAPNPAQEHKPPPTPPQPTPAPVAEEKTIFDIFK